MFKLCVLIQGNVCSSAAYTKGATAREFYTKVHGSAEEQKKGLV
jgi:hypothetical protein